MLIKLIKTNLLHIAGLSFPRVKAVQSLTLVTSQKRNTNLTQSVTNCFRCSKSFPSPKGITAPRVPARNGRRFPTSHVSPSFKNCPPTPPLQECHCYKFILHWTVCLQQANCTRTPAQTMCCSCRSNVRRSMDYLSIVLSVLFLFVSCVMFYCPVLFVFHVLLFLLLTTWLLLPQQVRNKNGFIIIITIITTSIHGVYNYINPTNHMWK